MPRASRHTHEQEITDFSIKFGNLVLTQENPTVVTIDFTFYPGTPDVRYLPNGDPGYPGEPPEINIQTITLKTPIMLSCPGAHLGIGERMDITSLISEKDYDSLVDKLMDLPGLE